MLYRVKVLDNFEGIIWFINLLLRRRVEVDKKKEREKLELEVQKICGRHEPDVQKCIEELPTNYY